MGDCCESMMKYVVFLCNFIFFVTGCVVIAVGVVVQTTLNEYYDFIDDKYLSTSVILMVAGGVIVLVAFFGCCGMCTENPCMLYIFGTLLALILIAELGITATVIAFKSQAWSAISFKFVSSLKNYESEDGSHEGMTKAWNTLQGEWMCCGVMSYNDWYNATNLTSGSVPDSCCVKPEVGCGKKGMTKPEAIYQVGCLKKVEQFITKNAVVVGAIGIGIVILQLIGISVVCCLASRIRELQKYV